jgi:hypothetical protein
VPELWQSWRKATRPVSILRVVLLTIVAFTLILGGFKLAIPQLQVGFAWKALLAVPGLYLYLGLMMALSAAFPHEVKIYKNRIVRQQGQHLQQVMSRDVVRARLVVFGKNRIRLKIWYLSKLWKRQRIRISKVGVSPKVHLDKLCDVFPVALDVLDARAKYAALGKRH